MIPRTVAPWDRMSLALACHRGSFPLDPPAFTRGAYRTILGRFKGGRRGGSILTTFRRPREFHASTQRT
jgi:hypothetical protein